MESKDENLPTYQLRLRGRVDEEFVVTYCPMGTTLTHEHNTTLLSHIQTDQSGILGLVRHLHNLGFTILALQRQT